MVNSDHIRKMKGGEWTLLQHQEMSSTGVSKHVATRQCMLTQEDMTLYSRLVEYRDLDKIEAE